MPYLGDPTTALVLDMLSSPSPGLGSELVSFTPSGTDATTRSVSYELDRHIVSILRFMTEVQRNDYLGRVGSLDLHSPIQKALDYAASINAVVDGVHGIALLGDTLEIQGTSNGLVGRGWMTQFKPSGDFGDVFYIHGDNTTGTKFNDVQFGNLYINAMDARSSGSLVHLEGVQFGNVFNVRGLNGWEGFRLEACSQLNLNGMFHFNDNLYSVAKTGRGLFVVAESSNAYAAKHCGGIFMSNFNIRGSTSAELLDYALDIHACDGLWFSNGHFQGASVANANLEQRTIQAGADEVPISLVFFTNVMLDETYGAEVRFAKGAALTTNKVGTGIHFVGCNMKGSAATGPGNEGILVESDAWFTGVNISGCNIYQFGERAIYVQSSNFRRLNVTGTNIAQTSLDGVGSFQMVEFAAGCGYTTFSGCSIGNALSPGALCNSTNAIKLDATSPDVIVTSCRMTGLQGDAISGVGTTTCVASGNILDENEVLIVASGSTITIPLGHNYAFVTGVTDINTITPRSHVNGPVTLRFNNVLNVKDGTGNLQLNGDFTTSANDTITLWCDTISAPATPTWYELARSAN